MFQLDFNIVILLLPLLLFATDIIAKWGFRCSIQSIGADLCMFAISFNVTTLLLNQITNMFPLLLSTPSSYQLQRLTEIHSLAVLFLFASLFCWLLSLMLISDEPNGAFLQNLRASRYNLDVVITIILGMISTYTGDYLLLRISQGV